MDYIVRAIDESGSIKISAGITTGVVEKARVTHNLSRTASSALGRTLTAGLLMTNSLKNEKDSITININGDGPIGRIVVTGKNDGKIKGYVNNPLADKPIRESDNKIDVGALVGKGILTVVTDMGLKEPYVGQVNLVSGEIAEDIANYLYTSEQIPSAVGLGVLVDVDYTIKAAGGFILQLLPNAEEEVISLIEDNLKDLGNVSQLISLGHSAEDIINLILKGLKVKFLDVKEVYYECDCSEEKVESALIALGKDELENILEEDGKVELSCHFCNKKYTFDKEELNNMITKLV
ncbi:Hsp33 family molecular chaperone HslO [Anaerosphaera multitolerans]|uniref:33 kDa chaperonin n=1 Tax=Anaerosphaera multitolerans TaxID=2487351 RepID=A0A437S7D1_9FIRM|nr:Hsp33 family molecular chaperone HslO [Anaerosphaera multitolerans]RVU54902.1 Hsp33 family molecular chaperone HslO [Anaerosphaera multitolerans]